MIGYKVIRKDMGYRSALMYVETSYSYDIGETTIRLPDTGPITVFETLNQALAFKKDFPHYDQHTQLVIVKVDFVPSDENKLWYKKGKGCVYYDLKQCPFGTRLAETVTPIEICEV